VPGRTDTADVSGNVPPVGNIDGSQNNGADNNNQGFTPKDTADVSGNVPPAGITDGSQNNDADNVNYEDSTAFRKTRAYTNSANGMATDTIENTPGISRIEEQNLSKMHYALSAEQVEKVYPDLVYENEDGSKSINYLEMIPLLCNPSAN